MNVTVKDNDDGTVSLSTGAGSNYTFTLTTKQFLALAGAGISSRQYEVPVVVDANGGQAIQERSTR